MRPRRAKSRTRPRPSLRAAALWAIAGAACAAVTLATAAPKVVAPGSDSMAVHRIAVYDHDDNPITRQTEPLDTTPVSLRTTCTKCHDYSVVRTGLHFNYTRNVDPGRPGEPWILADRLTGTQVPLSYRPWPGMYHPRQLGITDWQMTERFGRNLPGGGCGEPETIDWTRAGPDRRWVLTGTLEINCLLCHSGDPQQDRIVWARQLEAQNFRWAATAASRLAEVTGRVDNLPLTFDLAAGADPDDPGRLAPRVNYRADLFNSRSEAFFDIPQSPSDDRCLACHSFRTVPDRPGTQWQRDTDIHLAAGLDCTDCHRNGLGHDMTRGYEGEKRPHDPPDAAALSCRGCHMDAAAAQLPGRLAGRLNAPRAIHKALPKVHLDKLSCTACHSGPWPQRRTFRAQTSRSHALGLATDEVGPDALPYIAEPVFAPGHDGKLTPHRALWPAFWAWQHPDGSLDLLMPDAVRLAVLNLPRSRPGPEGKAVALTAEQRCQGVLEDLAAHRDQPGRPVYIRAGKLVSLQAGRLVEQDHPKAGPVLWPIAHNVRPVGHSLGIRGCDACHSPEAPMLFGQVRVEAPGAFVSGARTMEMTALSGLDPTFQRAFAFSFHFRPVLKVLGLVACGIVAVVLCGNLVLGLCGLCGASVAGPGRRRG